MLIKRRQFLLFFGATAGSLALNSFTSAKSEFSMPFAEFAITQTTGGDKLSFKPIEIAIPLDFQGMTKEELDGEEDGEDADAADIATFKEAVRILWGETSEVDKLPAIEPYQEGDIPDSIRIAVASNNGEQLDGHFGSCLRYLIYQLSAQEMRLIDIRSTLEADLSDDKNAFRVRLIKDCPVLYVVAIGGPAAAKVVQAKIYPMKKDEGGSAREILSELQHAIATSPPPWLAKILGVAERDRVKNYKALV